MTFIKSRILIDTIRLTIGILFRSNLMEVSETLLSPSVSQQQGFRLSCSNVNKRGFLTVDYADSKSRYFARRLKNSMIGVGTDSSALMRQVVSRAELNLETINTAYYSIYATTLDEDITVKLYLFHVMLKSNSHHHSNLILMQNDTSGSFQTALLALVN